jgi:hypothetical protein
MTKVKVCKWKFHDILINTLRKVYVCETCGEKLVVERYKLPPTLDTNVGCKNGGIRVNTLDSTL